MARQLDLHHPTLQQSGRALALAPAARPHLNLHPTHLPSFYERAAKPAIDLVLAVLLIVALAPVLAATAAVVAVQLGRPIMLRQHRVGQHGRPFPMYKFRTMLPDRRMRERREGGRADSADRRTTHKSPRDPRHTRVGRFLRRWSLDELPQLLNVVRGEMSLVGPRPEMAEIVATYDGWQHARHVVRPGLTGLWQVTERGSDELMREHVDLDLRYISGVSFGADVRIMLMTIPAALGLRKGS